MYGGGGIDVCGDGSGLCAESEVGGIDFDDRIHVHEAEDDGTGCGDGAAGKAGAGASGDDGRVGFAGEFHAGGNLFGGAREGDGERELAEGGGRWRKVAVPSKEYGMRSSGEVRTFSFPSRSVSWVSIGRSG